MIVMASTNDEALQSEVEFYRQNQTVVEREIRALIADNQKLSQQVGALLKEKLQSARNAHDGNTDEEVEELRKQVNLLTKERDSLHVLWQTSQKTIDALETELKTYQGYDGRGHQKVADEKRGLELKLQSALTDYIDIETKYKELTSKHQQLENELRSKNKELEINQVKAKDLEQKLEETSKVLEEHRINLAVEKKSSGDMKSYLAMSQKECVELVKKEAEAKAKVAEALQLFDVVSAQKNEAYKNLSETTEELTKLKHTLANVKHDTEAAFRTEIDEVKEKYNEKVADMLSHIKNLDSELVEKGLLLNKALREIKVLQSANESYLKAQQESSKFVDPKLALAEQRMEAMFQELLSSERRNIQMTCEKQCLAMDLQRVQDLHGREIKRRQWEETLLRTECDELRTQVEHLQKSLEETHGMVNKLQEILTSRTELNQKMVTTKEEELIELNKHLENQMELNKKWKASYIEMTEKLKKRLDQLQKENYELRNITRTSIGSSKSEDFSITS
ncbi:nuclear matrix constituent protein 1 [Plutella xylostella]|uniref:nuclear matrix constituent protein 1 n=1 Tax=Plutella xylostella TaxID=51655 RepID=UPI002032D283|nr:nuclear matrix constituent protein 1 [Plutella xylostella]